MSYAAALPLFGAVLLLAASCLYRAFSLLTVKPAPQERRRTCTLTASFWEQVFGRRRVKRLTDRTGEADLPG